jgi:hypothetical protein
MGRRAPMIAVLLLVAAVSSVVAYNLLWSVSNAPKPSDTGKSTSGAAASPHVLPDRVRAAAPAAASPANVPSATEAGAQQPAARVQPKPYGVVRLLGDGVAFYLGDPDNGGVLSVKRPISLDQLAPAEVQRLRTGVAVSSQAEALSLMEGLAGSAD